MVISLPSALNHIDYGQNDTNSHQTVTNSSVFTKSNSGYDKSKSNACQRSEFFLFIAFFDEKHKDGNDGQDED